MSGIVVQKSLKISLIAVFATFHATLYSLTPPVLWRNWAIYLEPTEGIILGPEAGFYAALIGSVAGRTIKPTDPFVLFLFGVIAEPLGVLVCAFLARGKWRSAMPIYAILLGAYLVSPLGRTLPLWTIADTLLALGLMYPAGRIGKWLFSGDLKHLSVALPLISFIGIATDALVRIFILVPAGLYTLFPLSYDGLYWLFVTSAISSYIEDGLVVLVSFLVGIPLLIALRKLPSFKSLSA
jgi:hypothetical protein